MTVSQIDIKPIDNYLPQLTIYSNYRFTPIIYFYSNWNTINTTVLVGPIVYFSCGRLPNKLEHFAL